MSSDAADSETKAGTDVSDDMTLLGSMKISEWPSSAVDKPKRKLPKHMRDLLEPGAEYTPWGDIIFELQGQDADGTLLPDFPLEKYKQMSPEWLNSWFSPPIFFSNINLSYTIGFAQIPTPIRLDRINRGAHFKWKWPLTHEERIKELEAVLLDERWERQVNDIKAAIEYHKEFDGNALCESDMINFHNGRRLEEGEYPPGQPGWVEVSTLEYVLLSILILN